MKKKNKKLKSQNFTLSNDKRARAKKQREETLKHGLHFWRPSSKVFLSKKDKAPKYKKGYIDE